jgi:hypothetical protein
VAAADSLKRVTLDELVATLSLVAGLGMDRPTERVLRQTVVAMQLGRQPGCVKRPARPARCSMV